MHRYTILVDGKVFVLDVRELGADAFEVQVDGKELNVKLVDDEELPEGAITPEIVSVRETAAQKVVASVRIPLSAPSRTAPATAPTLTAPMPGLITGVDVKAGATVRRGDPLLTLEAMKMRNSIRAPHDAVVDEVLVAEGQSVGFGEVLLRFRRPA